MMAMMRERLGSALLLPLQLLLLFSLMTTVSWLCVVFTERCAVGLCLSVCPSVTSRCSIEMAERIELVFGM